MSMEITNVHYNPDPKHIIIRSDASTVDCSNPVQSTEWLDGTLGETLCMSETQYMDFEKALCDGVFFQDSVLVYLARYQDCGVCGVLNAPDCCANSFVGNAFDPDPSNNCAPL